METAVLILKEILQTLLGCVKLLLDPKVWLMLALVGLLGFIRGCSDEKQRFDAHLELDDAIQKAQLERKLAIEERNRQIQQEVENDQINEMALLQSDLDDANQRLRESELRRFVPQPSRSTSGSVQSSCPVAGERDFLNRVYFGQTVCYDAELLDQGIRERVGRIRERLKGLAQRSVDALDDDKWWGDWARKIKACPVPTGPSSAPR